MNRRTGRLVLALLGAVVLFFGAGAFLVWWKIAGLKEELVSNLEKTLGAKVAVGSIHLDLWKGELRAAGITLVNQRPAAPWDKGDISQATLHFKLSDIFASNLPLKVEVSSWNLVLHSPAQEADQTSTSSRVAQAGEVNASNGPSRIQVTHIVAQDGTVEMDLSSDRKILFHGLSFQSDNNGGQLWTTNLQAASIESGPLALGASSVLIQSEQNKITFSELRMRCDPGNISGEGEVSLDAGHKASASLKAENVPITMLVAVQWQVKLSGLASGTLHYDGSDQRGSAQGQVAVNHGKFNVVPWLGKLTALVGLHDISDVELDQATSDFAWNNGTLQLTNLDIRKNEVTRIMGEVVVDPMGQVDGKLKLGLPSTVTAKWPQMQTSIFSVQMDGYNWTDVHLTGTPDHLQEDLTPRLLTVGMGQGNDLLHQATQKATDLYNSFMGK